MPDENYRNPSREAKLTTERLLGAFAGQKDRI